MAKAYSPQQPDLRPVCHFDLRVLKSTVPLETRGREQGLMVYIQACSHRSPGKDRRGEEGRRKKEERER